MLSEQVLQVGRYEAAASAGAAFRPLSGVELSGIDVSP
jgi:hypothetical protein